MTGLKATLCISGIIGGTTLGALFIIQTVKSHATEQAATAILTSTTAILTSTVAIPSETIIEVIKTMV